MTGRAFGFGAVTVLIFLSLDLAAGSHFGGMHKLPRHLLARRDSSNIEAKIVGGEPAPCGRFLYMASLRNEQRLHKCGGTLIDELWVLTAAHCVDDTKSDSLGRDPLVYLGAYHLEDDEYTEGVQVFRAVKTVLHPNYDGNITDGYDVALLKLPSPSDIQPCRLVSAGKVFNEGTQFTALGWGGTQASGGWASFLKQAPNLEFVSWKACNVAYDGTLNDGHLCAQAKVAVQNTCTGDSGGPLLIADCLGNEIQRGQMEFDVIAGVTSFGVRPCTDISIPAVYTNVAKFRAWIDSVIRDQGEAEQCVCEVCVQAPGNTTQPIEHSTCRDCAAPGMEDHRARENGIGNVGERPKTVGSDGFLREANTSMDCRQLPPICSDIMKHIEANDTGYHAIVLKMGEGKLCCQQMTNGAGFSLLHMAARKGNAGITRALLDMGVDVNFSKLQGWHPLHEASRWGHTLVVEILSLAGAAMNAADKDGDTALHAATFYSRYPAIHELVRRNATTDVQNKAGQTPTHIAALFGDAPALGLLSRLNADPNIPDKNGDTALHLAAQNGHLEAVSVLLASGADSNIVDALGRRPVDEACFRQPECEDKKALEDLLQKDQNG